VQNVVWKINETDVHANAMRDRAFEFQAMSSSMV